MNNDTRGQDFFTTNAAHVRNAECPSILVDYCILYLVYWCDTVALLFNDVLTLSDRAVRLLSATEVSKPSAEKIQ